MPNITHGYFGTRLYAVYKSMIQRTTNPNNSGYKYYGRKGVSICEEWKHDRLKFFKWAENNGYADNLVIDRIDARGDYSPGNCRFITQKENVKRSNARSNKPRRGHIKISDDLASEICEAYDTGLFSQRVIAKGLNVSRGAIVHLLKN